nr:uncharacterized protein LOC112036419 [Quercus suber]
MGGAGGDVAVGGEVVGVVGQEVPVGGEDSEDPLQLITAHLPKPAASTAAGSQVKKPAQGQSKPAAVVAQPAAKLPSRPPPLAAPVGWGSHFVVAVDWGSHGRRMADRHRPRHYGRRSRRNASALANQRIALALAEEDEEGAEDGQEGAADEEGAEDGQEGAADEAEEEENEENEVALTLVGLKMVTGASNANFL